MAEREPPRPEDVPDSQLEPEIYLERDFSKVIVVDNIPQVGADKIEKLEKVLHKVLSAIGTVKRLHLPKNEKGETKGYAFVEYATAEEAENAVEKANNYQLDKSHKFRVNAFSQIDTLLKVPEKYVPLEFKPYEQRGNLRDWLTDDRGLDQYVVHYDIYTDVFWNELKTEENPPSIFEKPREKFTDTYLKWSPLGSYLTTIHNKGVQIWGGASLSRINRFPHDNVGLIDFSPCEKYLVTASTPDKIGAVIIFWDVRTGKKLREFPAVAETQSQWPLFKWSYDDKYVARLNERQSISIYETPSMDLLDKKSLKVEHLKEFAWSPSDHFLAYTVVPDSKEKEKDKPATVCIIEVPSKKEKVIKSMFSVKDAKLYWQSSGDFLAVQLEKEAKSKKIFTIFQIFRLREKGIPSEIVELQDQVQTFAWEPKGLRFAVIHGEGQRPNISFYSVVGTLPKLLKTLEKKTANTLYWSPQGSFIVFAGLHNLNGTLEFYNVDSLETMSTGEHFMCTSVEWDPTGRYVATVVTWWRHQLETGYNIWSFSGKILKKVLKDKFFEFFWRPRPPSLLSQEKQNEIVTNIKSYGQRFKKEDEQRSDEERKKRLAKRMQLRSDFSKMMSGLLQEYQRQADERHKIPGYMSDDEGEFEIREEWFEEDLGEEPIFIG